MKKQLIPFALLALCGSSMAADFPGAGSQIQQVPPAPVPQSVPPQIRIEKSSPTAQPSDDKTKITVNKLRVSGVMVVPEAELISVSGFVPGGAFTLTELRGMASKIAAHLQQRGYFLAQAYLPAQESEDGSITIAVLLGQYGQVTLNNQSPVSDTLVHQIADGLSGQPITASALERKLLLLSDLPGSQVSSTLAPGASAGYSDLLIDVKPGARINGSVDADNTGNRYTGRNRVGATVNIAELAGWGDVASVRAFTSAEGLNYGRLAYQLQVGEAKIGAAYASMDYRLRKDFAALDASGNAKIASLYGSYPLIRSRSGNLFVQLGYDNKKFSDSVNATGSVSKKNIDAWMLNFNGDLRDQLGGGGINSFALGWTYGKVDIRSPLSRLIDELSVQTQGGFNKLSLSLSRLQNVSSNTMLYAALNAQWASKNLDISEKMGLGGVGGVRAYPGGEAYGDAGYQFTLELRHQLKTPEFLPAGQFQLVGFVDTGTVKLNRHPWTGGDNHRTLSGAGIGANWSGSNGLVFKLSYAHKLGNEKATSVPDASSRVWLQAVKYF